MEMIYIDLMSCGVLSIDLSELYQLHMFDIAFTIIVPNEQGMSIMYKYMNI